MKLVKHHKSQCHYLKICKITNATNSNDGQKMILYFGKYRDKFGWGFFVREENEFKEKFS
ncbi:MAG: hypothetical protein COV55_02290 [Candidatus Komeilibacteria bacterium CG11_big_fil_rev_8_21_14_0_20_36_20]|uniref:Uncharacterized protein n=1 Tax=Candidatus Komeilibacteria bacterium CG11_big_fil_rev_8_21_14_0_20_36_20 TaxID=1974477 RepID=A0A2H0ND14_9BACT|nr:MAG: hypothetical protein COV55_02290 [Candidatus Komeilibacteria bacterium CG11_big_fil_rev_8_21_14_0_20_36_20]PIR81803.1 MAG: hypothetical protein COU21_01350 [Candidatus Komeilibacteria bacterium CG10_big_fil_rev_8_21_14_0_10_36_65]PJC55293.1 MAG: hypothetical protein CO027_02685 [Candidatus Komeilibacteria bacterium CG_4_9_14_0_2_um_filter_36_13]